MIRLTKGILCEFGIFETIPTGEIESKMQNMVVPSTITFPNQRTAAIAPITSDSDLPAILKTLELAPGQPVLVIIGGAKLLSKSDYAQIEHLFHTVLAPIAEKWRAAVVDGGTDAGVMQLMGQARHAINGTFPLVGVAPIERLILPDRPIRFSNAAPLEPNHTHFLLVPGVNWGDESVWLSTAATQLAAGAPSVTILINGGEITWEDALHNVRAGRPLITIAGSGRTADVLAAGFRGEPSDGRAEEILATGLVQVVDLAENSIALASMIETIFMSKGVS